MVYPPGQGKSGEYLMRLWRRYLEQLAEREGDVNAQIVAGSYHAAEVIGSLSMSLDRDERYRPLILERMKHFREASQRAEDFSDCLVNATFALYNHMNTLCHQFSAGNASAESLIQRVDEQVHERVQQASQLERATAALRATFPLLSLMTLILGEGTTAVAAIRQVEARFAAASSRATADWEHMLNALYRLVEMMQILVTLSDAELIDQAQQIAAVFAEEDQAANLQLKLRNGFCRLFELGHLLATHLDAIIPS
jgi:DNA repair exonuclease SbcCD ATPase subunit